MRVLVLGASGFVGFPVAQALARAGYRVYGLTRSDKKAKQLAAEEIIPIVGNPTDPSTWGRLIATLDVLIDAVGGYETQKLSASILSSVSALAAARPAGAPKLTFVYSSGTWVHGEDRDTIVTDTTPISSPLPLVAWRAEQEQRVLRDTALNGIVIRPGMLYGRSASLMGTIFKAASEGRVIWYGARGARLVWVHQDDLAELYLRVAERGALVGGKIFDGVNGFTESMDDALLKLAKITGASAPEYQEHGIAFLKAISTTTRVRPYLARALLGWEPRKPGFVDGLEIYYAAWKASAGL